jgi:hypothetical protein
LGAEVNILLSRHTLIELAREVDYHQLGEFLTVLALALGNCGRGREAAEAEAQATEFLRRRYPEFSLRTFNDPREMNHGSEKHQIQAL